MTQNTFEASSTAGQSTTASLSCAYCLSAMAADASPTRCAQCGISVHTECASEAGRCPTCGSESLTREPGHAADTTSASSADAAFPTHLPPGPPTEGLPALDSETPAPSANVGPGIPAGVGLAPGWYPDTQQNSQIRWWNGTAWTDAVRPADQADAAVDGSHPGNQGGSRNPSRKRVAAAIGAAGALGAIAVAAMTGGPKTVAVDYSIDVEKGCYDSSSWGYADVDTGTTVEVFDGSGKVLGVGSLGLGQSSGYGRCVYTATFDVDRADDGVYKVTSGNSNRGFLYSSDDDIVDGTLNVTATLG